MDPTLFLANGHQGEPSRHTPRPAEIDAFYADHAPWQPGRRAMALVRRVRDRLAGLGGGRDLAPAAQRV